jgi:hypothetical protein
MKTDLELIIIKKKISTKKSYRTTFDIYEKKNQTG